MSVSNAKAELLIRLQNLLQGENVNTEQLELEEEEIVEDHNKDLGT